jgi:hypothetical protein
MTTPPPIQQPAIIPSPDVVREQLARHQQVATLLRRQLPLSIRAYPQSELNRRKAFGREGADAS